MPPTINIEFKVIGSTLVGLFDAAYDQMTAFLAGSGQTFDSDRLDIHVDGDTLDVSTSSGYSSLPGKYTAHCVYRAAR